MKDNYRCVTNQGQTGRVSLRTNFSKVENYTQQVFHTIHKMYETLKNPTIFIFMPYNMLRITHRLIALSACFLLAVNLKKYLLPFYLDF